MKRSELKRTAKNIVWQMLNGRCCPEHEDVAGYTDDEAEQEALIDEINAVLNRLSNTLAKHLKPLS